MKAGFYPRLALQSMGKNKRLYVPYLLTATGMVAMFYILASLASGGDPDAAFVTTLQTILNLGTWVVGIFAAIFLFYTNTFLMRRRKREFGLYNVLGMDKRNIGRVIFWENLCTAAAALLAGSVLGVLFSKLAELLMQNIMDMEVGYNLSFSPKALLMTVEVFVSIFLLLFLNSLRQIRFSSALSLMQSENAGEKPPRANWFLGVLGLIVLGAGYYLALSAKDPYTAITYFFVAVILVILGTYLVMIFGSVVLCRLLQKNKKYYYKANHFVSVSSMTYRMKRNGAGLASVCILATMILVMLSSTTCLYFGMEDAIMTRCPREITYTLTEMQWEDTPEGERDFGESIQKVKAHIDAEADRLGVHRQNEVSFRMNYLVTMMEGDRAVILGKNSNSFDPTIVSKISAIQFISLADYNTIMGEEETLAPGEVLLYANRNDYGYDTISLEGGPSFTVKRKVDDMVSTPESAMDIVSTLTLVVEDIDEAVAVFMGREDQPVERNWHYFLDTGLTPQEQIQFFQQYSLPHEERAQMGVHLMMESRALHRDSFVELYGGLFFLGIMLSVVFLFAAVLILYYKQIAEGYEDQSRFQIMQKVGMTKREIRRSINSQLLTVFFLPLLAAGIHMCFAFPMVEMMLRALNMPQVSLFMATTGISFLVFAVLYVIVYRITSNAYYHIVSGAKENR